METSVNANGKEKIREALDLLQETAKDERDELRSLARNRYADLKSVLGEAKESLSDEAGRLAELRKRGEEKMRHVAGRVDDYVHTAPWGVIATAAAFGLITGLLVNRGRG